MTEKLLIEDKHPQTDIFICDVADAIIKDILPQLEYPFYSLSKKPDTKVRFYEHEGNWLKIIPSSQGLATIYDKDILIFAISQLMAKLNNNEEVSKTIRINTFELLKFTNRGTSGKDYKAICDAIIRLGGVQISTNVRTGDEEQFDSFGLIESSSVRRKFGYKGRLLWCDITLSDWVFNAVLKKQVLTMNRDYFRLRKPIERRIYELARKQCGKKQTTSIYLEKLHKKTGSQGNLRLFKQAINSLVKTDHLPDYHVILNDNDLVTFTRKLESKVGQLSTAKSDQYTVDNFDDSLPAPALLKARSLARAKNRDWYQLKSEFVQLLNNNNGERKNIAGSFIGFIRAKDRL